MSQITFFSLNPSLKHVKGVNSCSKISNRFTRTLEVISNSRDLAMTRIALLTHGTRQLFCSLLLSLHGEPCLL